MWQIWCQPSRNISFDFRTLAKLTAYHLFTKLSLQNAAKEEHKVLDLQYSYEHGKQKQIKRQQKSSRNLSLDSLGASDSVASL
jgi:hypothetical protein